MLYADAKSESLHALEEKPPKEAAKLDEARAKHDAAREEYARLNAPLLADLVKFSGDKTNDFDAQVSFEYIFL